MQIHITKDGQQLGPFDEMQLAELLQTRQISYDDLAWVDGMTDWQALRTICEPPAGTPPPPPPPLQAKALPNANAGVTQNIKPSPETIGIIMLLVPLFSAMLIWIWVGGMNLFQNPSSSLNLLMLGTIISTAILGAVEANQIGVGSATDLTPKGKKRSGPGQWCAFILLMWIIGFPAYLYWRSRYGLKNLIVGGIAVALLFIGVASSMSTAIEGKKAEVRNALQIK